MILFEKKLAIQTCCKYKALFVEKKHKKHFYPIVLRNSL